MVSFNLTVALSFPYPLALLPLRCSGGAWGRLRRTCGAMSPHKFHAKKLRKRMTFASALGASSELGAAASQPALTEPALSLSERAESSANQGAQPVQR